MNTDSNSKGHLNKEFRDQIPSDLQCINQWITWQAGEPDSAGKFDKRPKGKDGTGRQWQQPHQWMTFTEASNACMNGGFSGVGLVLPAVLSGERHLVALDFDSVPLDESQENKRLVEIRELHRHLGSPYAEVSPSGRGIRMFVTSSVQHPQCSTSNPFGGKDELFCKSPKWVTVTGNKWAGSGVPHVPEKITDVASLWGSRNAQPKPLTVNLSHLTVCAKWVGWPAQKLRDGDGRESMMLSYAGHLRATGHDQAEIEHLCMDANQVHYKDPLENDVVLQRARRFQNKSLSGNGQDLVFNARSGSNVAPSEWTPLQDLPPRFRSTPQLDPELLPPALAGYVADCAKRMLVTPEMIASPLIVSLGSSIGKKLCVQPRAEDTSWREFPSLWGVSILPPAMRKSPSLNAAMKFINELEEKAQREHVMAMITWDSEDRVRKLEISDLESKAKKAIASGGRAEAKKYLDRIQNIKPPVRKRYLITDATPEARLEILVNNPNGVMLVRDELDGHVAQLRKDGYENARAQELQFFDGIQDYSDDRIKRGSHIAEGPRMSLYGNLQPAKVERYLRELHKGGSDDGYLQRMLQLAVQPTINSDFELLNIAPDTTAEGNARQVFTAADGLPLYRDGLTGRITPRVLKFDAAAQSEFDDFLVTLETKLRAGGISNPLLAAHLGKYRGTLAKLALILAFAEDHAATLIPYSAFDRAQQLLIFYQKHALRIYGVVSRPDIASAYELLDRIKKGQVSNGFNPRDDIQRREWEGLRSSGEIEGAIALLVKHGHLRNSEEATAGRTRRIVHIHPDLIRQKVIEGNSDTGERKAA